MKTRKKYRPQAIPGQRLFPRREEEAGGPPAGAPAEGPPAAPFAQVDIAPAHAAPGAAQAPPGPQALQHDEKRALFYEMRRLARSSTTTRTDHPRVFTRQALFMQNFEDDCQKQVPFSAYYPYYQLMDYDQLRTYFSWRTRVRKGNVTRVAASYAFVYIYELLGNIGVESPQQGLDRLLSIWRAFREFDSIIDKYLYQWLKDYLVYYPLEHDFRSFIEARQLQAHYPTVCAYGSGPGDSFDIFAGISKYRITDSSFYNEQTRPLFDGCFYHLLSRLRQALEAKKKCFEDLVFFPMRRPSGWEPFGRALFTPALKQPDREVVLSARESYSCRDNAWTYKAVILKESGRQFVGYILRQMEACLRQACGYGHRLAADISVCDTAILKSLEAAGISLPGFIAESTAEFYALYNRRAVVVDTDNLRQIRREALATQEKLIVPQDAAAGMEDTAEGAGEKGPVPGPAQPPAPPPDAGGWAGLRAALTPLERAAVKAILRGQDIAAFALQNGVMPQVLVDGINEKAADCVGDTVMELDGAVRVYGDYRDNLAEMVKY